MTRALAMFCLALVPSILYSQEILISEQYHLSDIEQVILSYKMPIEDGYVDNYYVENKEWTKKQKNLATSYLLANAIDVYQTVQMTNCQEYDECEVFEMNPLIGKRPSEEKIYLLKGTMLPVLFLMVNNLETVNRTSTLRWINRFQWSVVIWNDYHLRDQYGVELKYKF